MSLTVTPVCIGSDRSELQESACRAGDEWKVASEAEHERKSVVDGTQLA
jgi:hypothetical protein